jgi:hypothetical protein
LERVRSRRGNVDVAGMAAQEPQARSAPARPRYAFARETGRAAKDDRTGRARQACLPRHPRRSDRQLAEMDAADESEAWDRRYATLVQADLQNHAGRSWCAAICRFGRVGARAWRRHGERIRQGDLFHRACRVRWPFIAEHPKRAPAMTSGGGTGGTDYRSAKDIEHGAVASRPWPLSLPARGTVDRSASIWRGPSQS